MEQPEAGGFEGIAGNLADRLAAMGQLQMELLERLRLTGAPGGQQGEQPRDGLGRTPQEARRDYLAFRKNKPTFEGGRDRWGDFALRFEGARREHGVTDDQAKRVLFDAIRGPSSRLSIASMAPDLGAMQALEFEEYLRRMGEKFAPAAESAQSRREYEDRQQGDNEGVDEYIYAKWALFQTAYPEATTRERERFYELTAEGTVNFYLRDQLRMYDGDDIDGFVLLAQKRAETECSVAYRKYE